MRAPRLLAAVLLVFGAASAARAAGDVAINGSVVPKATSAVEFTQDLIDFREGGDPNPQVLPGAKHYGVCVVTPAPIAVLDAELPRADGATRMTVQIEDGRTFVRCLVASLKTEGAAAKRRLTYCLRCEDVTTP
jgi:hypothetical protein